MTPLLSLFREEVREQVAYHPHEGRYDVRLDANEAPDFWSETARQRFSQVASGARFSRYPDTRHTALRDALVTRFGGQPDEYSVGCGSDEVIANLLLAIGRTTARGAPSVVTLSPTFVMYRVSARVRGVSVIEVPLDASWNVSLPAMERAIQMAQPSIVFVATPNNPTGTVISEAQATALATAAKSSIVVFDEAYGLYARAGLSNVYNQFENVALLGTLSKIDLAGLRVGYLRARPELIAELEKARQPYNLPTVSQDVAVCALTEFEDEISTMRNQVIAERERVSLVLTALGCTVTPSEANFLWVRTKEPAGDVFSALKARSVLVRSFHDRGGRLANQLRVTIGTRQENDAFLDAMG